jgi:P pilus assembly chaperone PapD
LLQTAGLALVPNLAMAAPNAPQAALTSTQNAIQIENTYPGDSTWNDFTANLAPDALSGYASQTSVNHGGSINFFVTTTAASVLIDIYRMGWYGSAGARKMLAMGPFPGQHQAIPLPDTVTGMVACNWTKTATLTVPTTWTSGIYLAKLTASSGDKSFIYFVVRNDGGHEDFVFQSSVTTAEAYNTWGGTSLYNNNTDGSVFSGPHATKVSYDRPFNPGDGNGAGQFLWFEYPFVRWAESQGFDLTYITNIDTATNVNPLTNHKAFLSVGHDEYWSKAMRDNVESAINSGVNAAFFSANAMYWQIRLEPNAAGVANRVQVGYKDYATDTTPPGPDPQWGVNNPIVTTNWRDPVVNRPENKTIGIMYEDQISTASADYVVQNASNWVYAGTGFTEGTHVPGIVGYEYDRVWNNGLTPAGLTVLSDSPVTGQEIGSSHANSSIYTAASGARVFAAGTIEWSWGLDNYGSRHTANAGIQKTTANILYNFNGGSPPPPPPPPPPGTYLVDGFESGNLTQWIGPLGSGQATAESSVVNSGAFGAALTNQSGQYVDLTAPLAGGAQALTYTRLYFRLPSSAVTATLAQGRDKDNHVLWSVTYDAGRHGIGAYFWNGAGTRYDLYSASNIVAPDAWYGLEVKADEQASGHGEVWLNGASVVHVDGDLSTATPFNTLLLWNDGAGTVTYDDVVVSHAYNGPVGGSYPGPAASVSPASLTFPSQNVHTTSTAQAVTLTNTGTAPLTINSLTFSGANAGEFAQTNTCGTSLGVGASCAINVTFSPGGAGARAATLTLSDSAPSGTQSVALSGTGTFPPPPADGVYLQDGFESGTLAAWSNPSGPGQASAQTTVVNSGSDALSLTNQSGQYVMLTGALIGGGETQTYTRFYFRVASPASATTTIAQGRDQDGNLLWVVVYDAGRHGIDAYFWNGARARYDLYSNTNIVTPDTWYGLEVQSNEQTSGRGEIWLNGTSLGHVDGDLSVTQGYAQLTLMNEVAGTIFFDDVKISNVYNGPVGGGYPSPGASLSPTSLDFGDQNTGTTSAAQTVTLTNNGTLPLIIGSTSITGTNAADFVKGGDTCAGMTVAAGSSCTITISFAPGASGSSAATLSISDNAPSGTQSVALGGTGVTPPPPPPPADGVYFQDGFEGGSFAQWSAPTGPGQASVQSSVRNGGTYAAALTNGSGQWSAVSAGLIGGGEALTYTSFAFRIDGTAASGTTTLAQGKDANGALLWAVVYDAGRHGLELYVWNGARSRFDLYSNANLISPDTWYTLEIGVNEVAAGHAEMWLNGTSIASVDGDLSASQTFARLTLVNEVAGSIYFDDVKVKSVY